jgi:hypothetical protein
MPSAAALLAIAASMHHVLGIISHAWYAAFMKRCSLLKLLWVGAGSMTLMLFLDMIYRLST